MKGTGADADVLARIERCYDAIPRPIATTVQVGPFTVFLATEGLGWEYYARPRLGLDAPISSDDLAAVLDRLRELGRPEAVEWVLQLAPTLAPAARALGLTVSECPLLARFTRTSLVGPPGVRVEAIAADDERLAAVIGVQHAAFAGSDTPAEGRVGGRRGLIDSGLLVMVAAFESGHPVAAAAAAHRGEATEIMGVGVLPRWRNRGLGALLSQALADDMARRGATTVFLSAGDEVAARVYERAGFRRVGTAGMLTRRT